MFMMNPIPVTALLVGFPAALVFGQNQQLPPLKPFEAAVPVTTSGPVGTCAQVGASLCIPLDSSFSIVVMNEPGGSGPASAADPCQRNDDDSGSYALDAWSFDHFGTLHSTVYVNNNGNISFGVPFSTFSPVGFPVAGFPMVAPFWGDVDTGDTVDTFGGLVWVKEWSTDNGDAVNRLVVTWDNVGYFNEHSDLLNTFQVILTDGLDPLIGVGNNVCFCYDDMQWTTGDASGGVGGFGGSPATVGANLGDGVTFFQIGLFDHAGADYDGPGGAIDGVSFLDDNTLCFSIGGADPNTPPIFLADPDCPLDVGIGESLMFTVDAIGPELGETVTITEDGTGTLPGFSSISTPGNPGSVAVTFMPTMPGQVGLNTVTFTATDDGAPALMSVISFDIWVAAGPDIGSTYCDSLPNSLGLIGHLVVTGSDTAADENVYLQAFDLPPGQPVLFFTSPNQQEVVNPLGSAGVLCVGPDFARFKNQVQISDPCGRAAIAVDTDMILSNPTTSIMSSSTWNFQAWHRDLPVGTTNFTDAATVFFN